MIESESGAETETRFDRKRAVEFALKHLQRSRTYRAEAALEWFYTEGQCLFERSASGGQLRGVELASAAKVECPVCCSVERRMFCASESRTFDEAVGRGQIHLIDPERMRRGLHMPGMLPNGKTCPKCSGSGQVEIPIGHNPDCMVTARPTGHEVREHGYQVDELLMSRYAVVSRILEMDPRMERQPDGTWRNAGGIGDPYRRVLKAYYGPDATVCARVTPWSMHLAIFPLCSAGMELLKRHPSAPELRLSHVLQIVNIATVQNQSPKPERGELLERGYQQASAMLRDALEAFAGEMGR